MDLNTYPVNKNLQSRKQPKYPRVERLCTGSNRCTDCSGDMIIVNYRRSCQDCGLVDTAYQAVGFTRNYYTIPKHEPSKHFEAVLERLCTTQVEACDRFDDEYINKLKTKLVLDTSKTAEGGLPLITH